MPKKKKTITFRVDDGFPIDPQEQRAYVAEVSGFFERILRPKIENLIYLQTQALANPQNTREDDLYYKANINALSLILDWGDENHTAHISNIANPNQEG